ncbi:MAG: DnaD domain protein [Oscillospiraceae bacterium]|nr:DnaD domain protein [Oscillospiraceae bacterium]
MTESTFELPDQSPVTMTGLAAARLLEAADGDAALVYIYILKNRGEFSLPDASAALRMTQPRVTAAASALAAMGLLSQRCAPAPEKRVLPSDEMPQYDARDIRDAVGQGGEFAGLVGEVQRSLGHLLSSAELTKLFGIYNHLGLPPEVILTLISHCTVEYRRRYGEGRTPTMRFVEACAFRWEREGIVTLEAAETYLRRSGERNERIAAFRRELGLTERQLTRSERDYMEKWSDMGHSADAVALAYDKTVSQTGRLAWKYMDTILSSWHEKGLHTAAEAEKGDVRPDGARRRGTASGNAARGKPDASELARVKRALEEIKNG